MRHILVTNAKGGCGKSTIATSLAAYFASEGYATALADFDPQGSALAWLEQRPADCAPIKAVRGFESGLRSVPHNTDFGVIDSPAGSDGEDLRELVRRAEHDSDMSRGEIVIVVHGTVRDASDATDIDADRLLRALLEELSPSQAAKVAAKLTGLRRADLYEKAVSFGAGRVEARPDGD